MDDTKSILAASPVFQHLTPEQLAQLAPMFRHKSYSTGSLILQQGGYSEAIYFLVSGRLAVRVQRDESKETVAYLTPPDVFGELSFVTGKPCVADVEVVLDSEVIYLPKETLDRLSEDREAILRGLITPIATRLQSTVARGTTITESPVVLLGNHPHWEAPVSFGEELASSLGRQTGCETLVVNLGTDRNRETRELEPHAAVCGLANGSGGQLLRGIVAGRIAGWKNRFTNIILNPLHADRTALETVRPFANFTGEMLGPSDAPPGESAASSFTVQSAVAPVLAFLNGRQQLIYDAAESEAAYLSGGKVTSRFRRTVDSIARAVAGIQIGLALGGGAAWGWGHIGVLQALEAGGLPIDVISGCSMGSLIAALYACGLTTGEMEEIALYWRNRTRRFIEWRFWRMCLISDARLRKTLHHYFGSRQVNQTAVPYWANAVDVITGQEVTIRYGGLVECVRASTSLPGLLPPFGRDPHLLVDAAIMDPVPVRLSRAMGCHFAVAVNSMADPEANKLRSQSRLGGFEVMSRCVFLMGHAMGQAQAEPAADVVFTPDLSGVSMLEFSRSPEIIARGRQAAEKHLPAILTGYERLRRKATEQLVRPSLHS